MAKTKQSQKFKSYLLPSLLSILLIILLVITYQIVILDKFYPLTLIGDNNISLLTKSQAVDKIEQSIQKRARDTIYFNYPQQVFNIDLATASAKIDYQALDWEFDNQHQGTFFDIALKQFQFLISKRQITPFLSFNLDKQYETILQQVQKEPQNAELTFSESTVSDGTPSANIQIKEGKDGLSLEKELLERAISDYLLSGKYNTNLPINSVPPKVTTAHAVEAKKALESLQEESIKLRFKGSLWILDTKTLLTLLDLTSGSDLLLDKDKTHDYIAKIAKAIDQDVQEGLFEFNPQLKKVSSFRPSQEGRKLNIDKTYNLTLEALTQRTSKTITLPVTIIKPKIQTGDVNNLGIKELIGRGISHFTGSITNRIYNIQLAASRINGILIPPGEIFSFNEKVGDISAISGYKPAYVIKQGRTVLDDGGGVCQDSTTLFRAVLNAGLPVVQRVAHAYRVGYYEQGFPPGLDATVWAPSVDFKFKNDTQNHILIQAYTVGVTLYVDLYGTSDGRVATVTKPIVTDQTPPPPDLRQDDPTLAKGVVKQVDFAAWGAKVSFKRTVEKNGETIISETWNSSFRPWQAVYLVGTQ